MNLLIDQRDQKDFPSVKDTAPDVTKKAPTEDNVTLAEKKPYNYSRKEPDKMDYGYSKKTSSQRPFLFTILILVVSFSAVYLLYFRDGSKKPPVEDSSTSDVVTAEQQDDVRDDMAPSDDLAAGNVDEGPADTEIQESTEVRPALTDAPEPVSDRAAPQGSAVSKTLGTIIRNLSSVNLRTLYMDENAFTLEVSSRSPQQIREFYQSLSAQLAPAAQMAALPGQISGRTLLNGTISDAEPTDRQGRGGPETTAQIRTNLADLAAAAGVNVVNINFGERRTILGRNVVEVFIKVRGPAPDCQAFFARFTAKKWNYKVSKILLMPEQGQNTFVLRFIYFFPE